MQRRCSPGKTLIRVGGFCSYDAGDRQIGMDATGAMALSGTLVRGGETIFEGALQWTLDPALNYHHGVALGRGSGVESGDKLTLSVEVPP